MVLVSRYSLGFMLLVISVFSWASISCKQLHFTFQASAHPSVDIAFASGKYLSHVSMRERSVRLCSGEQSSQPTVWLNDALDPGDTMAKVIHCHIDMTGQSSHTYHLVEAPKPNHAFIVSC